METLLEPFPDLKTVRSMLTTATMLLKSRAQATYVNSTSSSPMVLLANSGSSTPVLGNPSLWSNSAPASNVSSSSNMTPNDMMALIQTGPVALHTTFNGSAQSYASLNIPSGFGPLPSGSSQQAQPAQLVQSAPPAYYFPQPNQPGHQMYTGQQPTLGFMNVEFYSDVIALEIFTRSPSLPPSLILFSSVSICAPTTWTSRKRSVASSYF
ncbi:hypothetical protein Tco_0916459 [Tanacetum coccineum]